jgi:hypothetical protein
MDKLQIKRPTIVQYASGSKYKTVKFKEHAREQFNQIDSEYGTVVRKNASLKKY